MRQESARSARERFADGLRLRFPGRASSDVPVIVSHGRIMSSWLAGLGGMSAWEIWTDLHMPDLIEADLDSKSFRSIDVPLL